MRTSVSGRCHELTRAATAIATPRPDAKREQKKRNVWRALMDARALTLPLFLRGA